MGPLEESAQSSFSLPETNKALAFDMGVRLWRMEVALATRKLLSLGHAYEVHYSLPRSPVTNLALATHFGLSVSALMDSHVFRVQKTEAPRYPMEFIDELADGYTDPIYTIESDDFLVGMDVQDFLLCPRKLKQLHKDVAAVGAEIRVKYDQDRSAKRTVVLRFIRMGMSVQPDPRQGRTPGRMLRALDEILIHHQQLVKRYDAMIQQDRMAVQRLHSAKKMLMYVKTFTGDTRKTLIADRTFQLTDKFLHWYDAITAEEAEHLVSVEKDIVMADAEGLEQAVEDMTVDMLPGRPEDESYNSKPALTLCPKHSQPSKSRLAKRRVTFAMDIATPQQTRAAKQNFTCANAPTPSLAPSPEYQERQLSGIDTAAKPRTFGCDEGRSYLLALVCPNVDIVSSIEELSSAAQTVPVLKMSKDFTLAAGLKLRRELKKVGAQYIARVRLGHLSFDCSDNETRKVKDAAFNYLVAKKIVWFHEKPSRDPDDGVYDIVAYIQEFPLICRRGSSFPSTKSEVVDALMAFLMELIDQYEESLMRGGAEQIKSESEPATSERTQPHQDSSYELNDDDEMASVHENGYDGMTDRQESTRIAENGESRDTELRSMGILKKRRYAPHAKEYYEDARGAPRPRISYAAPESQAPVHAPREERNTERVNDSAATNPASLFMEDRSGSDITRDAPPVRSEDEVAKAKSDIYQELLVLLFRDREKVIATIRAIVWDLGVRSEKIRLSSSFTVNTCT
ncbi:uncharacterized protein PITG_21014 [Phytophthora infestans T30-4]|uniref:Uncharacterized protein n=1 Tax=Phytophthora infestans (strain T30-4) TaxID=403677 RepID=D0P370_PHYIT|nr:uncharacterized protein PITG_21014 [Phytophthora infestans T30-4]EEY59046.1 conserved hypothetical protein [Phytophthora infestans T30-4]|eukprot:XP_002895260.1 conserved hypothetical protein [Phytophthora infestans T30-4]